MKLFSVIKVGFEFSFVLFEVYVFVVLVKILVFFIFLF